MLTLLDAERLLSSVAVEQTVFVGQPALAVAAVAVHLASGIQPAHFGTFPRGQGLLVVKHQIVSDVRSWPGAGETDALARAAYNRVKVRVTRRANPAIV